MLGLCLYIAVGDHTPEPADGDIVNLLHPTKNEIILRWIATGNQLGRGERGVPNSVGFSGELVDGTFNAQYADLPVDRTGPLRVGLTETNAGVRVTPKVWARVSETGPRKRRRTDWL